MNTEQHIFQPARPCPGGFKTHRPADWSMFSTTAPAAARRRMSQSPPPAIVGSSRNPSRRSWARPRLPRYLMPLGLSLGCAALLVGTDVLERHLLPDLATGWRHTLLSIRAVIVISVGCMIVYLLMRRQQGRISRTAEQLTWLLESYKTSPSVTGRFENPNVASCRDVLKCTRKECPMYDTPQERCWQVVGLAETSRGPGAPEVDIHQCHECEVYRRSCPDKLDELGESFNNLMFLLEMEAEQVGRMRSQLVEKEKMVAIGQMAAGIAHEVGNPLSSISSIVQMVKRAKDPAPANEQLDLIQTHIQRITTTVRQLVTLARPEREAWESVDVGQVLDEAVQLVGFDRRARSVEIDFSRPEALPPTFALRGQLQQVFINLALNALDAMPGGGKLTVHAQKHRQKIVVRITDTGFGIPPEMGRRVFEPFFTTKQPGRGTGLGLSVSYGIVHSHGGKIDFTSSAGEGTTFIIQIPLLQKPPDA